VGKEERKVAATRSAVAMDGRGVVYGLFLGSPASTEDRYRAIGHV
jgi:hypothetical protein